jgi:hypothetical protein
MNTTKALALAAFAALSLGAGTAMADGSDVINDYQAAKIRSTQQVQNYQQDAGGSDEENVGWRFGPFHQAHTPDRATVGGDGAGG